MKPSEVFVNSFQSKVNRFCLLESFKSPTLLQHFAHHPHDIGDNVDDYVDGVGDDSDDDHDHDHYVIDDDYDDDDDGQKN